MTCRSRRAFPPRSAPGWRPRATSCGSDRLVPFSCHGRGFCPSCGGRRMAERAAHLVDKVFPPVPVRQWVLSLPHRLRYRLAWDHVLCRAVVGRTMRAIHGFLRRRARDAGVTDGRGGAVAILQRFGGSPESQCSHPRLGGRRHVREGRRLGALPTRARRSTRRTSTRPKFRK